MLVTKSERSGQVRSGGKVYQAALYCFGRPDLPIWIRHCYKLIQNKDMRCDKHSEQNSRCNIEKRLHIFLTSTDPTQGVWNQERQLLSRMLHMFTKKKKFWYVFCGYIKLQASVVIRKESYKAFAASLWPSHKRHAGDGGGDFPQDI